MLCYSALIAIAPETRDPEEAIMRPPKESDRQKSRAKERKENRGSDSKHAAGGKHTHRYTRTPILMRRSVRRVRAEDKNSISCWLLLQKCAFLGNLFQPKERRKNMYGVGRRVGAGRRKKGRLLLLLLLLLLLYSTRALCFRFVFPFFHALTHTLTLLHVKNGWEWAAWGGEGGTGSMQARKTS